MRDNSDQKPLTPASIAILYALAGILWIVGSDYLLFAFIPTPASFISLAMIKGWLFVLFTTVLLYLLISRRMAAIRQFIADLSESEERYSSLFENNHSIMMLIEPVSGDIVDANPAACAFYGYSREVLRSKKITEINTLTPEVVAAEMARSASSQNQHFYFQHRLASGEVRDVEVYSGPIKVHRRQLLYSIIYDITEQKQAETAEKRHWTALQESQRTLATLMANLPGMVYRCCNDKDWTMTFVSEGCIKLTGYRPSELIDNSKISYGQLIHPDDRESIWDQVQAALQNQAAFQYVYRLVTATGQQKWVWEQGRGIFSSEGQLLFLEGFITDITEQKQAEEEIHYRNRELDMLNKIIASSAAGQEPEIVLETACRELTRGFAVPRATAVLLNQGRTEVAIVAEHTLKNQPAMLNVSTPVSTDPVMRYLLSHKTPLIVNDARAFEPDVSDLASLYNLLRQRGTVSLLAVPLITAEEVVGSLALESNEPGHFTLEKINLAWSVADQIAGALARLRLAQTHRLLITAIEQGYESVLITDRDGTIVYVNPAFERISGYSRAEVIGQNPRILKSGRHDQAFYENLWGTINAGQPWHGRIVNRKKDGTFYTIEATISPVRDEHAIVNYVAVRRDVTAELQREEQYRQAQKMGVIGRLAGGVAHDFNNLLTIISGYTNFLLQNHQDEQDPARKDIEQIKRATERAAELVRQLLVFSRKQALQPEILDLNRVVHHTEKMLRRLIGEDIQLVSTLAPNLGRVKADPSQMEQVILNLAVNGRDAMPYGGTLTIETANVDVDGTFIRLHHGLAPGPHVLLLISDTGIGMDTETRSHLFEPFFTTKEIGKGTGLGLATVYSIVTQSGGDIWVYSEPGQGSTFKIYLPRVDEPDTSIQPAWRSLPLPRGTETILLVEDEETVRTLAGRILTGAGYTVFKVDNGQAALQLSEQYTQPIHLLLTDVVMPHMSGRELAERLMAVRPDMKVLYMSGYTDNAIVRHDVLGPGTAFLSKPFTPDTLTRKIREVLEMWRQPEND